MYFISDFRNSAECGGRAACSVLCPPQPQGIHLLDWEGPEKGEDTASTFISEGEGNPLSTCPTSSSWNFFGHQVSATMYRSFSLQHQRVKLDFGRTLIRGDTHEPTSLQSSRAEPCQALKH